MFSPQSFSKLIQFKNISATFTTQIGTDGISSFTQFKIVPDALLKAPNEPMKVTYKNGAVAQFGNVLTPFDVFEEPELEWKHDKEKLYTLSMVDLDLPSKVDPILRAFQIWLVGNIPGGDVDKGDIIANYIGVGPPRSTGLHRFVLFMFEQEQQNDYFKYFRINQANKGNFNFMVPKFRKSFHLANFVSKFNLSGPIAGNFFLAQYDESVRLVYKRLQYLAKLHDLSGFT